MPNANGATVTDVKVTKTASDIEEETIASNAAFDVVVNAEAGSNVFNAGGAYKVQMVATDYTNDFITANTQTINGNFGDANWPTQAPQLRFAVPAQGPGREDHVYRAFAVLQAGNVDPIVDFEEGEIFVITHP
jgi:hypothetical protein